VLSADDEEEADVLLVVDDEHLGDPRRSRGHPTILPRNPGKFL
jgi:hypothetical protein